MKDGITLVIAAHTGNTWSTVFLACCFFVLNFGGNLATDLQPIFSLVDNHNFDTVLSIRDLCDAADEYQFTFLLNKFEIVFYFVLFYFILTSEDVCTSMMQTLTFSMKFCIYCIYWKYLYLKSFKY
jgi:hypothetical protein